MLENPMVSGYGFRTQAVGRPFFTGLVEPNEPELEEVTCSECNTELIKEEAHESLLWEDDYICDHRECIDSHYNGQYSTI